MEGVSSPLSRELLQSYAPIGLVCTPFIRITDQRPSVEFLRSQVRRERVANLSMQLLGNNADQLAFAARVLDDEGVGFVDLNFGCPSKQVMKKGVGAAMLSQRETIGDIVSRVRTSVTGRLSVKIRGGVDHLDETLEIATTIQDAGADYLVLHPRSGRQGYEGIADWRWIRRATSALRIPVVGNGDCWYAADAVRLMNWSGCDAVMIGRPCLRNPWIFRQIDELIRGELPMLPTGRDVLAHLGKLAALFEAELGPDRGRAAGALKEHAKYLLRAVPPTARVTLSLAALRATSCSELLRALAAIEGVESLDLGAQSSARLECSALAQL